jgi:WhiB family transcriptional regulator, redox-sensing transcriptional regulator
MTTIIADRPVSVALPGMVAEAVRRGRPACTAPGVDLAWFFPEPHDDETAAYAKRICAACPFRAECLDLALERDERFGIWGGLAQDERPRPLIKRPRACHGGCGQPAASRHWYCGDDCRDAARAKTRRRSELRRPSKARPIAVARAS